MKDIRIGNGYDVHRLAEGRKLVIGGVDIPFEKGLDGHSDADVLVHAVIDSLFGAAGMADIGSHFPDSDPKYKGADSIGLLRETGRLVKEAGFTIGNIDTIIVAQRPKMAHYIPEMKRNMSLVLGIPEERIGVKAKTEEKLGFTGSEEGMAAHAVALLIKE